MGQKGPGKPPRRSKRAPSLRTIGRKRPRSPPSRSPQHGSRGFPWGPHNGPRWPKSVEEASKLAQEASETAPRGGPGGPNGHVVHSAHRCPQEAPNKPQDAPKRPPGSPKELPRGCSTALQRGRERSEYTPRSISGGSDPQHRQGGRIGRRMFDKFANSWKSSIDTFLVRSGQYDA
eukprot:5730078-Pyramimonas_sp.AAC.1